MDNYHGLFYQGYGFRYSDPDKAIAMMSQARTMALQADNKEAAFRMAHWILQTIIFEKRDYTECTPLAVEMAAIARDPLYQHLRERVCVYQDLILSYMGIDPIGYADLIETALQHMQSVATPEMGCGFCVQGLRCSFEIVQQRLEVALIESNKFLALCDDYREHYQHHGSSALGKLAEIAFLQGEWERVLEFAVQGEQRSRNTTTLVKDWCDFLAFQAVAQRKLGNEDDAQRCYRRATSKIGTQIPHGRFYEVLCVYHEAEGELQAALHLRDRQLQELVGKGQLFGEARCRIRRMRYLKLLGQPIEDELGVIHVLLATMKAPQLLQAELAEVLNG